MHHGQGRHSAESGDDLCRLGGAAAEGAVGEDGGVEVGRHAPERADELPEGSAQPAGGDADDQPPFVRRGTAARERQPAGGDLRPAGGRVVVGRCCGDRADQFDANQPQHLCHHEHGDCLPARALEEDPQKRVERDDRPVSSFEAGVASGRSLPEKA